MDEERVERESRHLKKKGKHRDEDGKAKDKSKRGREEEAAGTDLSADIRENAKDEAVMGAAEEKEGHKSKKGKGRSEEKKGKVNVSLVSGSIENCVGEEQAKKSGSVALKPCPESATNKDNVKKDKKKKEGKKKEKEAETTEQMQSFDTSVGKEQAETSGLMVINPCLERGASKDNVKKDKKKKKEEKKKEKEADTTEQKQSFDTAVGKEQAETSDLEHAEGDTSKHNLNKDKKKKEEKKEEKEAEMTGQKKQTLDTTVDNSGAEYAERDKVEVKQSSKSKKSKRKHDGGAPAAEISAADQIVKREDKKRKKEHSVVLEESSQTRDKGETREVKKGGKESSKACPDYSENAFAGGEEAGVNGKNDKKKKKSKGIGGGKKEKEKAARSMKGKQVSFADSVEMFRTEGSDGEGIGGGKQKKRAAPSKKKGKRVSFADSAEVFSIEGGDNEEDARSNESKLVHGDQFTPEEDTTLMEAMRGYVEMKQLGEKGLEMLRYVRKYPEVKGCWHDIAKSLPHRPYISIYGRAQALLSRSADCKWTDKEKEQIRRFVEKNGKDWKTLAQELGKSEILVKGAWRRIRPKKRKGADNEEDGSSGESKLVHGRRFTAEEDAILMEAMRDYAELKQLGEKGLEMIRSCKKYPTLKGCWDDIGKSLPHRPREAIYKRAHILLDRSAERKWTDEERDRIKRFVLENGTDFKTLAKELGKSRIHLKDTWRRIKPKNLIKGRWTQEEHQNLFDLVNLDLRLKAHQIKISDHRMLRENISWEAISDKLTTRNHKNCCLKWYDTLASPMVKEGIWADVDDYLLVEALQNVDAVCIEDVDWDSVLDHRSGEVCRRRWNQMVRAIGGHREKPFIEQVEVLSTRYCPEMMEYRN